MTIRVRDRLRGTTGEPPTGPAVLARYVVPPELGRELFLNSFVVSDGTYLVPDSGSRWRLLAGDSEQAEGVFGRGQSLDPLDAASIRALGASVDATISAGGTWLDLFGVSPLVPEMSERAELQPLEALLIEQVGHLEEVCRRPRTHLRVEVERTAVSRARRFPAQAANYLAAHTEDWERPTLRSVVPKRILAVVREDQFDIYENRVAVRLVDHLLAYLVRRVLEVTRLLRVFEEADDHTSSAAAGSHWRQNRIFRLWGESIDAGEARRKAARTLQQLKHLNQTVAGMMDSVLYREVSRRATVQTTLTMTNILSNDVHYRRVADLWLAWARLGQHQAPRPREHFTEMQALCGSFNRYVLLIVVRALEQLGFEPVELERALSAGEATLRRGDFNAVLGWSSDGVLTLRGDGVRTLRLVPICSSIALLDEVQVRGIVGEADSVAGAEEDTLVLYPTPPSDSAYERFDADLAGRLRSLPHEVSDRGSRRAGFMPVSPWDVASVERVARQLRWVTVAPRFLGYPPVVRRSSLPNIGRDVPWLAQVGDHLRVTRAPYDHEKIPTAKLVEDSEARVTSLTAEREAVSARLAEAVRAGRATGDLNARKKSLHAEITEAEASLAALHDFRDELNHAMQLVEGLLQCPTCRQQAERREFIGSPDGRFSCTCAECKATWGTVSCPKCRAWIPTLLPSSRSWVAHAGAPGWVDRTLGADVLAVPSVHDGEIGFLCPHCRDTG